MVRLVLAGSDSADLGKAQNILASKGVTDVSVCERESQVLQLLHQCPVQGLATVIIAQQGNTTQGDDAVDALRLLQKIPASQARVAAISSSQDASMFQQLVEAGALDILQSPISEQADRLHFLAAKWQHTLQTLQPAVNTDFSADCGDSAQHSFNLSLAQMPPLDDAFEELLGPGSATSCGTSLDWDESDELAQSILPGLFGSGADLGTSPFDMIEFGAPTKAAHGQPSEVNSGSSESSVAHVPSFSRQTSLTTCFSGKRRSEDMGEHSRGTSCDTSRPSDLMDDARCKKQKVEWTPELHNIFASVVESIGVDRAVPSQILSGMGAAGTGLTRQNIASHLQKYRNRSRINSVNGMSAPMPMRTASAPLGSLCQPMSGAPLLSHSSCQLPALLPGAPCWAMGIPQPAPGPTGWAAWPAVVPSLPQALPPPAPSQPSLALLASLQQAMREPTSKPPLGLRLDTDAVRSSWKAVAGGQ